MAKTVKHDCLNSVQLFSHYSKHPPIISIKTQNTHMHTPPSFVRGWPLEAPPSPAPASRGLHSVIPRTPDLPGALGI